MLWHSATVREGRQDLVYNSCGIYEVGVFSSFVLFGWGVGRAMECYLYPA